MLKRLVVLAMLLVCCYCAESNDLLTEETRAKKKKKAFRLIAMVIIFLISKLAVIKVASFIFFFALFQKLFALGGVLLTYMMKNQSMTSASFIAPGVNTYGPPAPAVNIYDPSDYNTVGYSYGPPEHEPVKELPSITDLGGAFNWLSGKH